MPSPSHAARLAARALVRVSGPDWRSFLHGLLTQDVETLAPGELRHAALLTPQGRLLHEVFVLGLQDAALLDVAESGREPLIARLAMYRLRAKVEISPAEGAVFAAWDAPPLEKAPTQLTAAVQRHGLQPLSTRVSQGMKIDWSVDPRLTDLGWRGYGDAAGGEPGDDAYDAHRLSVGTPNPGRDCIDDKTYPIEANFDLLNGIDFKKGCFVGQETTSRMKRRGPVKSRMVPIAFEGPPPPFGSELLAGELRAGELRSGRPGRAIALVRLDRAAGAALTLDGRPARLDPPAWLTPALLANELAGAGA